MSNSSWRMSKNFTTTISKKMRQRGVNLEWERGLADASEGFAATPDGFVALLANGIRHAARRIYPQERQLGVHPSWHTTNLQAVRVQQGRQNAGLSRIVGDQSATLAPRQTRWRLDPGAGSPHRSASRPAQEGDCQDGSLPLERRSRRRSRRTRLLSARLPARQEVSVDRADPRRAALG